jgi:hypothetical protein
VEAIERAQTCILQEGVRNAYEILVEKLVKGRLVGGLGVVLNVTLERILEEQGGGRVGNCG